MRRRLRAFVEGGGFANLAGPRLPDFERPVKTPASIPVFPRNKREYACQIAQDARNGRLPQRYPRQSPPQTAPERRRKYSLRIFDNASMKWF
jgi:hypothetical protein